MYSDNFSIQITSGALQKLKNGAIHRDRYLIYLLLVVKQYFASKPSPIPCQRKDINSIV